MPAPKKTPVKQRLPAISDDAPIKKICTVAEQIQPHRQSRRDRLKCHIKWETIEDRALLEVISGSLEKERVNEYSEPFKMTTEPARYLREQEYPRPLAL